MAREHRVGVAVALLAVATRLLALPVATQAQSAQLPPLIPRAVLFGDAERRDPRLSPDGTWLGYLAPDDERASQIWIRSLSGADDRMLTAAPNGGVRSFFWAYDSQYVLYPQDNEGDQRDHLYAIALTSRAIRDLTPFEGVNAQLIAYGPRRPTELLVGLNWRDQQDPGRFDVYRLDLATAAITLDTANPGNVQAWMADPQLRVRAALASTSDGGGDLLVRGAVTEGWRTVRHWGPEDSASLIGYSADGRTLYWRSSLGADTQRVLALQVATDEEAVLAADPQYDAAIDREDVLSGILVQPETGAIQAVAFQRGRLDWEVLDPSIAEDFDMLAHVRRGDFQVVSRDLADRVWIVMYEADDAPTSFYCYIRAGKASAATLLFSNRPALGDVALAPMEPISYEARDGLMLHGYLTTPLGVPARGLPAVLLVHGGPHNRDVWGFNPEVQWLTNRGYAVLQVNYRGSTGYGKRFRNAGNGQWAGQIHDDLIDGVHWLDERGIADPRRIGIMGGSFGGYCTLVGLTFPPDVFAAGVAISAPTSLVSWLESLPPTWASARAELERRMGGSLPADAAFLESQSPLHFVDRLAAPLLIVQGAHDPRVREVQFAQLVGALRAAHKPVEAILYPDEGHSITRPANRLQLYALAEAFLARYLGGRLEPAGELAGAAGIAQ